MEAIVKSIFKQLVQEIESKVPEVKHVDWFNDQYGKTTLGNAYFGYKQREIRESSELSYVRPAVFLEFDKVHYLGKGSSFQTAELMLFVHLVTEQYSDSRSSASDREAYLERLNLLQNLSLTLHKFRSATVFQAERQEIRLDHRQSNLSADVLVLRLVALDRLRFVGNRNPITGAVITPVRGN